jgi:hypothetical protein
MSKLLTFLPNEIWYEIVAFFPLKNVVNSIQFEVKNEIELFKKYRFIKLKQWRNHLLHELLQLWSIDCAAQESYDKMPSSILKPTEFAKNPAALCAKISELFKIINLPWMYQKCGVGVSYQRKHTPTL